MNINQPKMPKNNTMSIQPMRGLNGHEVPFGLMEESGILATARWKSGIRYPTEITIQAIDGGSGSTVK